MTLMNASWNRSNYNSRPPSVSVDYGYCASLKKVFVPRWLSHLWLISPLWEWESLPHWLHVWQVLMTGSPLIGCGQDRFFSGLELLAEDTAPSAAVRCFIFPALCVDVHGLHLVFADIFEALLWAANSSLSRGKFAVEDDLGFMATHLVYMAKPSQPALSAILVGVVSLGFSQMQVVRHSRVVVIADWQK